MARLSAPDLLATALPEREVILDPILSQKSLVLLYGPRGLGKTFVALGIAWAAASGGSFLKWRASRPRRVIYLDGEMAAVDIQRRLAMLGPAPPDLDFILADLQGHSLPDLGYEEGQAAFVRSCGRPDLVVLDNLASLAGFRAGDPDCWSRLQRFLMLLRRVGVAVLIVHHANKKGLQRGTSRREDVLDTVIAIRRPADYEPRQGARFELHFEKARGLLGEAVDPIEARLETDAGGRARWSWQPAHQSELERAVALLNAGLNPSQVGRELGISIAKSYRLRARAMEKGLLG
ncbi:MAG: AAA family ATPase [Proteobacteria bacterium]|nr:AAA family ATPase [Pseudomonadota bacterium]